MKKFFSILICFILATASINANGSIGATTVATSESIQAALGNGYIDVELTDVADVTVSDDKTTCQILTYIFEVTPKDAEGNRVSNDAITSEITFRLPVPTSLAGTYSYTLTNVVNKTYFPETNTSENTKTSTTTQETATSKTETASKTETTSDSSTGAIATTAPKTGDVENQDNLWIGIGMLLLAMGILGQIRRKDIQRHKV